MTEFPEFNVTIATSKVPVERSEHYKLLMNKILVNVKACVASEFEKAGYSYSVSTEEICVKEHKNGL